MAGTRFCRLLLIISLFFFLSAWTIFGQPSIAFLDAVIDPGIDVSAQGPVTETIIQHLVGSGEYKVLDRANIAQVLREKEFQLSGLVRDEEVKQAGQYLGAAFVGVGRISRVGETYFISAKIINVETGAITAQTSSQQQGDIDVVLALADDVGRKLSGGRVEAVPAEQQVSRESDTVPSTDTPASPAEKRPVSFFHRNAVGLTLYYEVDDEEPYAGLIYQRLFNESLGISLGFSYGLEWEELSGMVGMVYDFGNFRVAGHLGLDEFVGPYIHPMVMIKAGSFLVILEGGIDIDGGLRAGIGAGLMF